ncbi:IST1 homolog [Lathamus discolor]|uniref:IST1 homolog n=1 Tax=Lathamus discolor TaxID=678569 RepID=UPI0032B85AE4
MHKLNMEAPHKILVERYLIQIAKNYNVPYEPGSVVMAEAPAGEEADLIDVGFTDDVKKGGHGGGGGGGFTAPLVDHDGLVSMPVMMPMPMPTPDLPFSYLPPKGPENFSGLPVGTYPPFTNIHPPPIPATPPTYESIDEPNADKDTRTAFIIGPRPKSEASPKPKAVAPNTTDNFVLPELPSLPDTLPTAFAGTNSSASEDISRRFEELKKKT